MVNFPDFLKLPQYGAPGIVDGIPGNKQMMPTVLQLPTQTQAAVDQYAAMPAPLTEGVKPSLLRTIVGSLADGMAVYGHAAPVFGPGMDALQEKTDEERKWQAQLAQQKEIALMKASDHGDDSFTRAMQMAGIQPGMPEYVAMARKRAQMLTEPVQLVSDGMGGYTAVRPNAMAAPPSGPVGKITPFQMGGGGSNVTGGFRP
jgi:hypothetical protein